MAERSEIKGDEATALAVVKDAAPSTVTPSSATGDTGTIGSGSRQMVAGRYEVHGLLGVGGMGSVYRARDTELDELVALKVLRRELIDTPGMLERFRQEVRLSRRVTHRNVARMFDIGEHEGEKFLTMELVDGEPLDALICREAPLPTARIIDITTAVCEGLAAAHAAGVVHRDLKPDNVLLAKDGRVVLTDFGIARALGALAGVTMGVPIGTPAYMAPEQVEGANDVDARADVYALGTILFEMMTGERAWGGDSVYAVAAARLVHPPPDPRTIRNEVREEAARIVVKCMARRREDRYARVEDVAAAVSALADTGPRPKQTMASGVSGARPGAALDAKALAVLPFRNAGADADAYLADGFTDDLIDSLSMINGLRVRSRGSVMRYKGEARDAREIGRELDVTVVVEGSVRRQGDALRVTARLVSVADGFQLWAKRFDREGGDLFRVGDEAADAIARALTVERDAPRDAVSDPATLDLYLRARHLYYEGWREATKKSIELFEAALARAPDDPRVLSGYALTQLRRFGQDPDGASADEAGEKGRVAAERAIALAPRLGEARSALALYRMNVGDMPGCARDVREALKASPQSADLVDLYGRIAVEVGRPEQGISFLRTAVALEPDIYRARADIAKVSALLGDYRECDAFFAATPASESAKSTFWFYASRLACWRGDAAWSAELLERAERDTFPMQGQMVAILKLVSGGKYTEDFDAALAMWGAISSRAIRRPIFFRQLTAEMRAFTGADDAALLALEDASRLGLVDIVWVDRCPLFARMRATPRFARVREAVATHAAAVLTALTEGQKA
jgi:TolB-like protein